MNGPDPTIIFNTRRAWANLHLDAQAFEQAKVELGATADLKILLARAQAIKSELVAASSVGREEL